MKASPLVALVALPLQLLLLSCGEPDPNARSNNPPVQNPQVETSPGPKTGTGGETQANPPSGNGGNSSGTEKPAQ